MLLDLTTEWAGIIHESAAASRMAELKADLDETWFAWSGPVTVKPGSNITAYYRIQGPHVVIEYAPQTLGGDPPAWRSGGAQFFEILLLSDTLIEEFEDVVLPLRDGFV